MRKTAVVMLVVTLFGPASALAGMAVLVNPAAQASCLPGAGLSVGNVPGSLAATTTDGTRIRLNKAQLTHTATIIEVGAHTKGVGRDGVIVALMAALTESSLRMLSNTSAHPESAKYPHDGNGGDHDSLGLFQMRPNTGWGTVGELMDPTYQARAFFGGGSGPNHGSPRGLLDIGGWTKMSKGAAAQAVEVSAYPDRYARFEPVAQAIAKALTQGTTDSSSDRPAVAEPETGQVVFPLPSGTWARTSTFGMRVHPITGVRKLHTGVDFAAKAGTPILAAADGRVARAGPAAGYGNLILIEHTVNQKRIATGYAHMTWASIRVKAGELVSAGQHIADVGSTGYATGPHLHFEVRPGAAHAAPINPEPWLKAGGAVDLDSAGAGGGCGPDADAAGYSGTGPGKLVDDPTTTGKITARTAHILAQVKARFPHTSWSCFSPQRPGQVSEHSLGRACDGTFGNSIGHKATGRSLALGWKVTNWMKANARTLGVEYLIWQGRIWSVARSSEGWRAYNGGGMFDPGSVTGGHFDHLHWTARS